MPTTSVSAMPRSPRYSWTQLSRAARWKSRRRTSSVWKVCRYSCAIVPIGTAAQVTREQHVGGALEELRHLALENRQHFTVPRRREAPAHAEVEELERRRAHRFAPERVQPLDLGGEPAPAFGERHVSVETAEVELVDDGEDEDL